MAFHTPEVFENVSISAVYTQRCCTLKQGQRALWAAIDMSTVKELSISYDAVNGNNTFTNGDVIHGRVFFDVSKEVRIESLYIKCKGEAKVSWSERRNDRTYHYSAHERYFKLKQYFMQDPSKQGEYQVLCLNKPAVLR